MHTPIYQEYQPRRRNRTQAVLFGGALLLAVVLGSWLGNGATLHQPTSTVPNDAGVAAGANLQDVHQEQQDLITSVTQSETK